MDRLAIARTLGQTADLLALTGREPFRARAYARGARVLERLTDGDFERILAEGRLTAALAGIGRGLAAVIGDLARGGRSETLEKVRTALPAGAGELARVPHLGLRKIQALHAALGVDTVAALRAACEAGRVRTVKGFGEKTERRMLESIRALETTPAAPAPTRVLLPHALDVADRVLAHLRAIPGVTAAEIAGDLRRWTETVDRLVVVLAAREPAPALEAALGSPLLVSRGTREGATALATLVTGLPIELRATTPELREDDGEVEAAAGRHASRGRWSRVDDVQGLVHCHTALLGRQEQRRGDGARRGRDGHEVHHHHRPLAHRVTTRAACTLDRLKRQWDEIARVQEKVKVRLLRGTEVGHPGRRRARLPGRGARAARRGRGQRPQPLQDGRGPDDARAS